MRTRSLGSKETDRPFLTVIEDMEIVAGKAGDQVSLHVVNRHADFDYARGGAEIVSGVGCA